jgi:positive regulator of sigma E activity
MDENYTYELGADDRLFLAKTTTIQSMNQNTALIKENKEKMYSKIFYVFSLIFVVLIAIFAESLNWVLVFLFVDLSLIILIWFAKRFYKTRRELAKNRHFIIKRLNEFGIPTKE